MYYTSLPLEFFAAVIVAMYIVKLVTEIVSIDRQKPIALTPGMMLKPLNMEKRSLLNQSVKQRLAA